ncbi:GatB/YqeY domain-containing protein [Enterococcus timonensis]|uniref:GatB/YqeY domain-containing protein n=1 Tax=Enterococcus timonensis TaxID=1852364 RepID=UPI0008DADFAA|nr:GatB/YqeY domain-containing protein [Enterococcus timonensis]
MSLVETINQDVKIAMKARDKETLNVVRMVKASLQNEGIKKGDTLTSDEELTVLAREMKQRKESLVEFSNAGRADLVEQLEKEIAILDRYMPKQLTTQEVEEIVKAAILKVDAKGKGDFGKVMGLVMPQVKGKADGKVVNEAVKNLLN